METDSQNPLTDAEGNELGKLFVGGLAQETSDDVLRGYFEKFGEIDEAVVMMDNRTRRSRGFGYVKFCMPEAVDYALSQQKHIISGKEVDAKLCNVNMKGRNRRSLKVFLGGIAPETNEEDVRCAMSEYGTVTDVNLMLDPTKQRHRGFAYVGFTTDSAVKQLIRLHFVNIGSKQVEVKAMEPPRFTPRPPAPFAPPMSSGGRGRGFRPQGPNYSRPYDDWNGSTGSYHQRPPWASSWSPRRQPMGSSGNWDAPWHSSGPSSRDQFPPPPSWEGPRWNSGPPNKSNNPLIPPPPPPLSLQSQSQPSKASQWNGGGGWGRDPRSQPPAAALGHGYHPYKRA